ncbi:hypothetical protein ACFC09_26365 [Streptomyces sp. NPDC056161]|uniref:hypothetical protein n=1 Tax=Streptomyces sp. NPDC056161 TaxID=3345732 RepID=UPI0035E141B9
MPRKSRAHWDAFVEGLHAYYAKPENLDTSVPSEHVHKAKSGIEINMGSDLRKYRRDGVPVSCPEDVRDVINMYGVLDVHKHGPSKSRAQWDDFVEGLQAYYEKPENLGTVPRQRYVYTAKSGDVCKLGIDIKNWRKNGLPQSCPQDVRDVVEMYRVLDFANPGTVKSREQWDAFIEGLQAYYEKPENLGTVPYAGYLHVTEDGVESNVGVDLNNYRARGIPKSCPPNVRGVIEEYLAEFADPIVFRSAQAVGESYGDSNQSAGLSAPEDLVGSSVGGSFGSGQWEVPLVGSEVGQWAQWTLPPGGGPSVAPGAGSSGQAVQMPMPAEPTHENRRVIRRG